MKKISMFDNMDKGILCSSDMKSVKYRLLYFGLVLIMLVYCAVVFIPVLWMLLSGFKSAAEINAHPPKFFPQDFQISKIVSAWTQLKFYKYYVNTFILAAGAVVFDVVVNGLAGYVISKIRPLGSRAYFALVFSLLLIPATMSTVPLYIIFKKLPLLHINLLDTYWPMWLLAATNVFDIVLFKTSFDSVSIALTEAARIDGASDLSIFFRIMIPLSLPVILTVSIFTFNGQFGSYFWPYLFVSSPEKMVIGVRLLTIKDTPLTMDYQLMAVLFAVVPQVIIFMLFQKHIIGGINLGGVKG